MSEAFPPTVPPTSSLQVGRYRLLKELGKGGMGAVYLAEDTMLGRKVALKLPFLEAGDETTKKRFFREAKTAATLTHPNICPVYDVGEAEGKPFLVMALIEGQTLSERVAAQPLTPLQAVDLTRVLALVLHEAHTRGIIHRDLKPSNVMIDHRGQPIVMDFGLARQMDANATKISQSGTMIGTPAYMSPEQMQGEGKIGPASDVYSLGVMFYELLSGVLPFRGPIYALIGQVLYGGPPAPPSAERPGLDPKLDAICLKALARDLTVRYSSMLFFAQALEEYQRASRGAVPLATPPKIQPQAPVETVPPSPTTFPPAPPAPPRSAPATVIPDNLSLAPPPEPAPPANSTNEAARRILEKYMRRPAGPTPPAAPPPVYPLAPEEKPSNEAERRSLLKPPPPPTPPPPVYPPAPPDQNETERRLREKGIRLSTPPATPPPPVYPSPAPPPPPPARSATTTTPPVLTFQGGFLRLQGDESILQAPDFLANRATFPVAYGLGLQALKLSLIQVNLLPPQKASWWSRVKGAFSGPPAGFWGIDIGQCGLKALRVEEIDGEVHATDFDYIEYPKILSQPDADPDALIREALEQFLSRREVRGDHVAISVPGQSGLVRFLNLPPVEEQKIDGIVKFEAKQQIPLPLEEVVWGYQKVGQGKVADGFAFDTEIALLAMKRDMVERYLQPFRALEIEVHLVQMASIALCNYLAHEHLQGQEGKKRVVVLLDVGTDTSNLVITDAGSIIWQRSIPLGGNHMTRAMTKDLKLTFAKAEHLKRNATKSPDLRQILAALKPVLNDYVGEVQRSLGYFTNTHRDARVEYMIGAGNAFHLPGFQRYLSEKLALEVCKL